MIAAYVPQRHKCGEGGVFVKACLICSTDGFGFFESNCTATIIIPLWQYPHCGTCSSIHACCTGCRVLSASPALKPFCAAQTAGKPSIVVTSCPTTPEIGVMQLRISAPSSSPFSAQSGSALAAARTAMECLDQRRQSVLFRSRIASVWLPCFLLTNVTFTSNISCSQDDTLVLRLQNASFEQLT